MLEIRVRVPVGPLSRPCDSSQGLAISPLATLPVGSRGATGFPVSELSRDHPLQFALALILLVGLRVVDLVKDFQFPVLDDTAKFILARWLTSSEDEVTVFRNLPEHRHIVPFSAQQAVLAQ